ncbi:ribonuclease P protein component [Sabulicella rubraurantiaca]|uniref:ribonuclease P protein component n=1 Tax=Sabulicella rubraurantiaca TaxID=2811429 RepID=UPI001A95E505|nr:ribonuclease P protein component [Sabulicella rubraurantiaca]
MLSRLKRRAEFLRAAREGRKAAGRNLVLQALPRPDSPADTRLGFTATKKIGNAVTRNRAKRRMRAAARLVLEAAPAPGHDIVLIARDGTATCPFPALLEEVSAALRRAGARP